MQLDASDAALDGDLDRARRPLQKSSCTEFDSASSDVTRPRIVVRSADMNRGRISRANATKSSQTERVSGIGSVTSAEFRQASTASAWRVPQRR